MAFGTRRPDSSASCWGGKTWELGGGGGGGWGLLLVGVEANGGVGFGVGWLVVVFVSLCLRNSLHEFRDFRYLLGKNMCSKRARTCWGVGVWIPSVWTFGEGGSVKKKV